MVANNGFYFPFVWVVFVGDFNRAGPLWLPQGEHGFGIFVVGFDETYVEDRMYFQGIRELEFVAIWVSSGEDLEWAHPERVQFRYVAWALHSLG